MDVDIKNNIEKVFEGVEEACIKAGRSKEEIKILAVTKTVDVDIIKQIKEYSLFEIGENKPQEIERKYELLKDDFKFHLIGNLQSNKINKIIDKVVMIQSLDSIKLTEALDKRLKIRNMTMDCLIEVNVSNEESKSGFSVTELMDNIEKFSLYENVKIRGLMTMAPFTDDEYRIRKTFEGLYNLKNTINNRHYDFMVMEYLSMGMSHDYKLAIEEGSDIVRIGTSIFGKRNY